MRLIKDSINFSFSYVEPTQESGLLVGAVIVDLTTGSPVLAEVQTLTEDIAGIYDGTFSGTIGHTYAVACGVFNDVDFLNANLATLDSFVDVNYPPETEVFQCVSGTVLYWVFDYTAFDFNDSLDVQASIDNLTTGTVVADSLVALQYLVLGVYFGAFTGEENSTYRAAIAVYTDNTFGTIDTQRSAVSENFQASSFGDITVINNVEVLEIEGAETDAVIEVLDL